MLCVSVEYFNWSQTVFAKIKSFSEFRAGSSRLFPSYFSLVLYMLKYIYNLERISLVWCRRVKRARLTTRLTCTAHSWQKIIKNEKQTRQISVLLAYLVVLTRLSCCSQFYLCTTAINCSTESFKRHFCSLSNPESRYGEILLAFYQLSRALIIARCDVYMFVQD